MHLWARIFNLLALAFTSICRDGLILGPVLLQCSRRQVTGSRYFLKMNCLLDHSPNRRHLGYLVTLLVFGSFDLLRGSDSAGWFRLHLYVDGTQIRHRYP
jgi:hypothetical protein